MVASINKLKIIKKRTKIFKRHQSDRYTKVTVRLSIRAQFNKLQEAWRKPKGIDNRVRRRFRGQFPMPKIGYGSNAKTKFLSPDGFKRILVKNVKDLELLMMHNRSYSAEIANAVSSKNRVLIVERARQLNVKVTNAGARLRTQEDE